MLRNRGCRRGCCYASRGLFAAVAASVTVVVLIIASVAPVFAMHIPVPTSCQPDADGANDQPGQKDVTQFCTSVGTSPFEFYSSSNWDETTLTGNNTADVCTLFNTDGDAFANIAVCVTLKSSGPGNGNLAIFSALRLFSCADARADRCTGSVPLAGTFNTNCEVAQKPTDPFGVLAVNGPGTAYPTDTEILCAIDLGDFGVLGSGATLLDSCSYPSTVPNSDPSDCVLYRACTGNAQCDDANPCTIDICDPSGVCAHTPNTGALCNDGLYCNGDETCGSLGFCDVHPGRSCSDGVACTLDSCDELTDSCLHTPSNSLCTDGLYCNGVELCDLTNGCQAGIPVNCSDGVGCTTDACNEATDTCTHTTSNAACDDSLYCNGSETCNALTGCQAGTPVSCSDSVACTVDSCNEATDSCVYTPNNATCSDGLFCNGAETCDAVNGCQAGAAPDCNDGVACTTDACNEAGDICDHMPNNAACSDGQFCNGAETCDVTLGCQAGLAPACGDGVPCTVDTCNEGTDSCDHAPNNVACSDGLYCTGVEVCDLTNGCLAGTPVNCGDSVSCTVDACNEATDSCDHTATDALCDNNLYCDGGETCNPLAGCQNGTPVNCGDDIPCTTDACNETTDACDHTPDNGACSDGQFCTGVEICNPSVGCEPGTDPCPALTCDEGTDQCVGCLTDAECDNAVYCDGQEACVASECQPGTPVSCNDSVSCTVDACNESTDSCDHAATDALCDNGLYCDGGETCNPLAGCQAGTPVVCNDGVSCTLDACNEATDACSYTPNNGTCGNGLYCDGDEVCDPLLGCQVGPAPNCSDGIACTADACNESTDSCDHVANDGLCNDALYCNGVETCSPVLGCVAGTAVNCSEGVACTVDACNEITDSCDNTPNDGACSDGSYCNGAEICNAITGCGPGTAPACVDAIACTVDSCDESTDSCLYAPNAALCADSLYCDGVEVCNPSIGCQEGPPIVCADGFVCSTDSCDESTDACVSDFDPCVCGDSEVTGTEQCDPPLTAGTYEDCNNLLDDDGDGEVDCRDTDCKPKKRAALCDENCALDQTCEKFIRDPAVIKFNLKGGPDSLWIHGRYPLNGDFDPLRDGLVFQISNERGPIYRVSLPGEYFSGKTDGKRFSFRDVYAPTLGQASWGGGLYKVGLLVRDDLIEPYLSFRIRAYGDLTAATRPVMTTQIAVGTQVGSLTAEWTATGRGWKLASSDY